MAALVAAIWPKAAKSKLRTCIPNRRKHNGPINQLDIQRIPKFEILAFESVGRKVDNKVPAAIAGILAFHSRPHRFAHWILAPLSASWLNCYFTHTRAPPTASASGHESITFGHPTHCRRLKSASAVPPRKALFGDPSRHSIWVKRALGPFSGAGQASSC